MYGQSKTHFSELWAGALTSSWGRRMWQTQSGLNLEFQIFPYHAAPPAGCAIFMLVRKTYIGRASARQLVYIGNTDDLHATLADPALHALCDSHGALDVHVRRYTERQKRDRDTAGLIARLNPFYSSLEAPAPEIVQAA